MSNLVSELLIKETVSDNWQEMYVIVPIIFCEGMKLSQSAR